MEGKVISYFMICLAFCSKPFTIGILFMVLFTHLRLSNKAIFSSRALTIFIKRMHTVSACTLYGGTYCQFKVSLPRLGIQVKFAKDDDPASFDILVDDKTKALYVETLGNPKVHTIEGDS
jgi:cystathionine beta-lyase/cystathionine gamma-synthase